MSSFTKNRILPATCSGGQVFFEQVLIPGVVILSKGIGPSEGYLILQGDFAYYVASNALDIEELLTSVIAAVTKIAETLTAIGGGMTGGTTAPPPTLASNVAAINTEVAKLTTLKGVLK